MLIWYAKKLSSIHRNAKPLLNPAFAKLKIQIPIEETGGVLSPPMHQQTFHPNLVHLKMQLCLFQSMTYQRTMKWNQNYHHRKQSQTPRVTNHLSQFHKQCHRHPTTRQTRRVRRPLSISWKISLSSNPGIVVGFTSLFINLTIEFYKV